MNDDNQVPSFALTGRAASEARELDRFMKRERAGIAGQRGKLVWSTHVHQDRVADSAAVGVKGHG